LAAIFIFVAMFFQFSLDFLFAGLSIFRGNYKTEEKEMQNNICENTENR
jgi:hypothetical protein